MFSSRSHKEFTQQHILGNKILDIHKGIQFKQSMFSDHNGIKFKVHYRLILERFYHEESK